MFSRRNQRSLEMQEKNELRQQMIEDSEDAEDFHDWVEDRLHNPNFNQAILSEEEKLKQKTKFKVIERKYFKKSQEINLLTWDAKEQIRFLSNEYPDEWTVDRLSESFPVSRDGVVKLLKSQFRPKSLEEVVKHDRRVQKNWKQLKEGKRKGMLAGGPIISRYEEILKNAAGNPSLPMPDLNRLLLSSGKTRTRHDKPGAFLSIVKDYCDKRDAIAGNATLDTINSTKVTSDARLAAHISQSKKLVDELVDGTKQNNPNLISQSPSSKIVAGQLRYSGDGRRSERANRDNARLRSKQLIDADFDSSLNRYEQSDHEDGDFDQEFQRYNCQRGRISASGRHSERKGELGTNSGIKGARNLSVSDKTTSRMEENARFALKDNRGNSRKALDTKTEEAIHDMKAGTLEDGDVYMFSEAKGYQHPFGRKKDLPRKKISVPQKPGAVFMKDGDYFDEDGEFLYRTP